MQSGEDICRTDGQPHMEIQGDVSTMSSSYVTLKHFRTRLRTMPAYISIQG